MERLTHLMNILLFIRKNKTIGKHKNSLSNYIAEELITMYSCSRLHWLELSVATLGPFIRGKIRRVLHKTRLK